jgi:hypothetical protein
MGNQKTYHFDVPAVWVWISHILIGLLLIYIAYLILEKKTINKYIAILLIVIGVIAIFYHAHIWYIERQ